MMWQSSTEASSGQDHVAFLQAALISLVATFIQFLHCSEIEDLTWKQPTSDLMFLIATEI